ncbi:MAG: ATP-dependent protease ATPase subunit HslU [Firmicutes bacterium]|nr:ATP-dependent protease ATPase subunit HslU [Bacillota bacterium]
MLTPKQIVAQLDRYIIGQHAAKRAVAVALRNRYRRAQLPAEVRDEITPKNIIMKGPTGVGKTEIARRLAKLVGAPFIKVEATKYTEVGYVGRDVESMVRDLVEVSIRLVRDEKRVEVEEKAKTEVEKRILEKIIAAKKQTATEVPIEVLRAQCEFELKDGKLEDFLIEMDITQSAIKNINIPGGMDFQMMGMDIGSIFGDVLPKKTKKRQVTVHVARKEMLNEEMDKLIDNEALQQEAITRAEQHGIIFIDEIDKIASKGGGGSGPEVSREGVQRDILPIVEGSTIQTKHGPIKTDYILFIAAGAFHISRVQDLIPELQGRFPIRVELQNLGKDDFYKILTQTENSLIKQYSELLAVDKVSLSFDATALKLIAELAEQENETQENIGARRLSNIMEILLEDIAFNADGKEPHTLKVDKKFITDNQSQIIRLTDLRKYVL